MKQAPLFLISDMTITPAKPLGTLAMVQLLVAVPLIMAAGWGIRGSFGHSRGAAMPGGMLGLCLAVMSMRADWWKRGAILGFQEMCPLG